MEQLAEIIEGFKSLKVLVVGDAILDTYIKGTTERLCREAPVPVLNVTEQENRCGGAANVAINLAALGATTYFITVLGQDSNGYELKNMLNKHGVVCNYIIHDQNRKTIAKKRITAYSNILLRVDEGNLESIFNSSESSLIDSIEQIFPQIDVILISDYGYGVVTDSVIESLIQLTKNNSKPIVVDSKALQRFAELRPTATKPNYEEAVKLISLPVLQGKERVEQILENGHRLLIATGARCVTSTIDTEGTIVFEEGKAPYRILTVPQDNKKSIGAGDTFISAFSLSLACNIDFNMAGEIGSAAASLVLQKEGTVYCTLNDLKTFFAGNPKYIAEEEDLILKVGALKKEGKRIVFTNGCFDILHSGHVNLLHQAKLFGDVLIVGLNDDEGIKRLKGENRPLNGLDDRISVLAGLESVDYLASFSGDSPTNLLELIKPDVFVKGGDYTKESIPEAALVQALGGEVKIVSFLNHRSTSLLIKRMKESNSEKNSGKQEGYRYA